MEQIDDPVHRLSGRRFTRRELAPLGAGLAVTAITRPVVAGEGGMFVDPKDGWYVTSSYRLSMTWDPDLWELPWEPGTSGLSLYNTASSDPPERTHYFGLMAVERSWASIDEAAAGAIDAWFSQGMSGATVLAEWSSETAYGWAHTSDSDGDRNPVYMEYAPLDTGGTWQERALSIDAVAFSSTGSADLYDALTINGGKYPQAVPMDELMALFAENLSP